MGELYLDEIDRLLNTIYQWYLQSKETNLRNVQYIKNNSGERNNIDLKEGILYQADALETELEQTKDVCGNTKKWKL